MAHSWRSTRNRYHPYQPCSPNRTNRELIVKRSQSDGANLKRVGDDVKGAGDSKLSARFESQVALRESNESFDRKCIICLDSEPYTEMQSLPCGHSFHSICISRWFKKKTKCPVCRHSVLQHAEENESDEFDDEETIRTLYGGPYENDHDSDDDRDSFDEEDLYEADEESDDEVTGDHICPFHFPPEDDLCPVLQCPIHGNRVGVDSDETDDEEPECSSPSTEADDHMSVDMEDSSNSENEYADGEVDEDSESDEDSQDSDDESDDLDDQNTHDAPSLDSDSDIYYSDDGFQEDSIRGDKSPLSNFRPKHKS